MVFLQLGVPGGVELLVLMLIMLMLFGLPLLLVAVGGFIWFQSRDESGDRIEELESEVSELRNEVDGDANTGERETTGENAGGEAGGEEAGEEASGEGAGGGEDGGSGVLESASDEASDFG